MRHILLIGIISVFIALTPAMAQYPPQAGIAGSTSIHKNSGKITAWASGCRLWRGLQDVAQPSLGYVSTNDSSAAIGAADGNIVSLGDSGVAVVTFAHPVADEPGPDFAVFENGFINPAKAEEAYMEFAFVEVSSDGVSFFRFPAASTTQTSTQIAGAGQHFNARAVNNLAGKYVAPYGTPFDLASLQGTPGLDLSAITHLRIVDVIGSIGSHASLDDSGRVINDPYPTPFPTGGFDLDAVAVLHGTAPDAVLNGRATIAFTAYPNPASGTLYMRWNASLAPVLKVSLTDAAGRVVWQQPAVTSDTGIPLLQIPAGLYFLQLTSTNVAPWVEKVQLLH